MELLGNETYRTRMGSAAEVSFKIVGKLGDAGKSSLNSKIQNKMLKKWKSILVTIINQPKVFERKELRKVIVRSG